jgi:hypothetical protein
MHSALKNANNRKRDDTGKRVSFLAPNWNMDLHCRPQIKVAEKLNAFLILQNVRNSEPTYDCGEYFATLFRAPV